MTQNAKSLYVWPRKEVGVMIMPAGVIRHVLRSASVKSKPYRIGILVGGKNHERVVLQDCDFQMGVSMACKFV